MTVEMSREQMILDVLFDAFLESNWSAMADVRASGNRRFDALIRHKSLPVKYMPIALEIKSISEKRFSESLNFEIGQLFPNIRPTSSDSEPISLLVNVGGLEPEAVMTASLRWFIYHSSLENHGPIDFTASVAELLDNVAEALGIFEKLVKEDQAKRQKLADSIPEAPFESETAELPPLPFELTPGADPNDADIVVIPVSETGQLSGRAKSIMKSIR